MSEMVLPDDYTNVLEQLKREVAASRLTATRLVNTALIDLYWKIGAHLNREVAKNAWGGKVFERLADDLRKAFPGMSGLSRSNLFYMRKFAAEWPDPIVQQPAGQLPWAHVMVLLDQVKDLTQRNWYASKAVEHGWSRGILLQQIRDNLYARSGTALTNFAVTLPANSDLAQELLKNDYMFDFLNLTDQAKEREIEDRLVANIEHTLAELGPQFAFVARQRRFDIEGDEFKIDLLFFNMLLNAYVVIELKAGKFKPEYLGQLALYVGWVDNELRQPHHGQTVGLLLCADGNQSVIKYALGTMSAAIGVSTYRRGELSPEQRAALPNPDVLRRALLGDITPGKDKENTQ